MAARILSTRVGHVIDATDPSLAVIQFLLSSFTSPHPPDWRSLIPRQVQRAASFDVSIADDIVSLKLVPKEQSGSSAASNMAVVQESFSDLPIEVSLMCKVSKHFNQFSLRV
jgi:hypothetical protein